MNVVLDNFDLVAKAFGYTIFLFLVSAVLSLVLGTVLVAFRVGPISVLSKAASVYVTVVRNTPLVIIFLFFQLGAGKVFDCAALQLGRHPHRPVRLHLVLHRRRGVAEPLHLVLRLRGPALRRQRRAPRPGRGGAGHRAALQRA